MSVSKKNDKTEKRTGNRRINKKSNRKTNKRKSKSSNKKSKKSKGGNGDWVNVKNIIGEDICPICHESFKETPEKAIYKTSCGHVFHNDCLDTLCDLKQGETTCPICRKPLLSDEKRVYDCIDVSEFTYKNLFEPKFNGDEEIKTLYNNQPEK